MKNKLYIGIGAVMIIILGFMFLGRGDRNTENLENNGGSATTNSVSTKTNANKVNKPVTKPSGSGTLPAGAKPNTNQPGIPTPIIVLDGSIFHLVSYNGVATPSDSKYTLSFENGSLRAKLCNELGGNYTLDGNNIKAANLLGTKMYCSSPSNLMEIESTFSTMMNFGSTIVKIDNTITIINAKNTMVFRGF